MLLALGWAIALGCGSSADSDPLFSPGPGGGPLPPAGAAGQAGSAGNASTGGNTASGAAGSPSAGGAGANAAGQSTEPFGGTGGNADIFGGGGSSAGPGGGPGGPGGGPPIAQGAIDCATSDTQVTPCSAGQGCCLIFDEPNVCTTPDQCPVGGKNAGFLACDSADDCPGARCCIIDDGYTARCKPSCGPGERPMCKPGGPGCPGGQSCMEVPNTGGLYFECSF